MCTYQLRRRRRIANRKLSHCHQPHTLTLQERALARLLLDPHFVALLQQLIARQLGGLDGPQASPRASRVMPTAYTKHRPMRRPGH